VAADLLQDLADESYYLTSADIAARARSIGFSVRTEERAVALVVGTTALTPASTGVKATTKALREVFGACLVGEVDGEVLAAVSVRPTLLRSTLEQAAEAVNDELAATVGGRVVRLVAGPLVDDVAGLARSLPAAQQAARLANTLVIESRVVLANDLGVYHLLSSVVADTELERFVNDQLGPLLEVDARTGSELVPTLDAYLDAGLSKTAAAAALGIRRQTLYARLERIGETLVGVDLGDRRRRTAVDLALVSWRLRTAAASYRR
jgi:purine catabolism regulator